MDKNRFLVIMAGGAGTRFWPCSRSNRPKQFLDFFGTGRTLLQQTFDRFAKIIPTENIFIASNKQYKDLILEQLPILTENQLLLEPARRNTAPCIAYAMNKIASLNPNANVVIAPIVIVMTSITVIFAKFRCREAIADVTTITLPK